MSAIFISHSSADNEASGDLKAWLEEQGYTSLFLDFDPESGIAAGSRWEETLYYKLRQCQAVIVLLSPSWLASKWCFAELVQAREKGKAIFVVKIRPCETQGILDEVQQIDMTAGADEARRRLASGLRQGGLDPRDIFDLDPHRPPYPGLSAFQEDDAALFFGREEEIHNGLETLAALRLRSRGAPRFVVFLGASGSGKSSLVRAGLIPRLKKMRADWLAVAPFRPREDPLDELALALAETFGTLGDSRGAESIRGRLRKAAEQEPIDGSALPGLVRELAVAAGQREATAVLTVDQAEELFGESATGTADRFLHLLRASLETPDPRLMAIATLRSDFLGELQTHPVMQERRYDHDFAYRVIPVEPMPERNFCEIVRGPARLAGLSLDDGLVETMVGDTATRDALPLLAFMLRRLYERRSEDGRLLQSEYERLGGIEGSIRVEAERILEEAAPSTEDLEALRDAFVPAMVRINAEGGHARRRALSGEMTSRARAMLQRFVDARLVVSGRDANGRETLEVAHEALLRTWPQLTDWLTEDQDNLRLTASLHRAAGEWHGAGRAAELLVHRDGRLQDAEALVSQRRFALPDGAVETTYLEACRECQVAREAAKREEQERRIRDAERIAEAQRRTARLTMTGLAVALALTAVATWQFREARENGKDAMYQASAFRAASLLAKAQNLKKEDTLTATLVLVEALGDPAPLGGEDFALELAGAPMPKAVFDADDPRSALFGFGGTFTNTGLLRRGHEASVVNAVLSPGGQRVAGVLDDGTARIWRTETGYAEPYVLKGPAQRTYSEERIVAGKVVEAGGWTAGSKRLLSASFSPDGKDVLTLAEDGEIYLWTLGNIYEPLDLKGSSGEVSQAIFGRGGEHVLLATNDDKLRIWDVDSGTGPKTISLDVSVLTFLGLTPIYLGSHGRRVLVFSGDQARLWSMEGSGPPVLLKAYEGPRWAALSPDGERVLVVSREGTVRVWTVDGDRGHVVVEGSEVPARSAVFSPDGRHVLVVSEGTRASIWPADGRGEPVDLKVRGGGLGVFSPDGSRVLFPSLFGPWEVAAVRDGQTVELDLGDVMAGSYREVQSYAFSPDGNRIVMVSEGYARVSTMESGETIGLGKKTLRADLRDAVFSPDGRRVLTVSDSGEVSVWAADGSGRLVDFAGLGQSFQRAVLSPDGERLLLVSKDGTARVWSLPPLTWQKLLEYLRRRTTVCLSADQRELYLEESPEAALAGFAECERGFGRTPPVGSSPTPSPL